MSTDRYWLLLGKKKSGEATPEELEELAALSPEGEEDTLDVLDRVWVAPMEPVPETFPHRNVWHRVQKSIYSEQERRGRGRLVRLGAVLAAAGVLGAVVIGGWYMSGRKAPQAGVDDHPMNQVATQAGSKTKIALPDGTLVWLNGNSQLTYGNKSFGSEEREVTLSGEAFFDVVKNEKLPFIIHTKDMTIRVLGTAFTVKAYPKDKTVETSLIRGLVEITTRRDPERKIVLKPNEKIVVPVEAPEVSSPRTPAHFPTSPYSILRLGKDTATETVWMRNKLEFDNEPLEELAPKMAKWYNIHIYFRGDRIRKKRFSGVIEKETLTQTLEAMKLSSPFEYEIKDNELWLREN
ncbi:MAG TPA: FecR domain-containing protein [Puia sp.]|nr:FecR domain-containing protein [Puia sp.]